MHPRIAANLARVEEDKREVLRRSLLDLCDAMEGLLAQIDTNRVSRFAEHCGKIRDLVSRDDLSPHSLLALADSLYIQARKFADAVVPQGESGLGGEAPQETNRRAVLLVSSSPSPNPHTTP